MKVSTKGRYALRLMIDLALHPNQCISIKEISQRQQISHKYLEQIITLLVKSGYVKSARGPQGGYMLAMSPSQMTTGMVLRLMEGSLNPISCLDEDPNSCAHSADCITMPLWRKLKEAIDSTVDSITLQDLIDRAEIAHIGMWL